MRNSLLFAQSLLLVSISVGCSSSGQGDGQQRVTSATDFSNGSRDIETSTGVLNDGRQVAPSQLWWAFTKATNQLPSTTTPSAQSDNGNQEGATNGVPIGPPPTPPNSPPPTISVSTTTIPVNSLLPQPSGQVSGPPTSGYIGPTIPNSSNTDQNRFMCSITARPDRLPTPRSFEITIFANELTVALRISTGTESSLQIVGLENGRQTIQVPPDSDGSSPRLEVFQIIDNEVGPSGCSNR